MKQPKIALVHDWVTEIGGAERVLKSFHAAFPEAPIYTLFKNDAFAKDFLPDAKIFTSFLQNWYRIAGSRRLMAPMMPTAIESFDLGEFDVVISTGAIYSKGIIVPPRTLHINYCHSPSRQFWDRHAEQSAQASWLKRPWLTLMQHATRIWDRQASARVDGFWANSMHVAGRIKKYYHRTSEVVYPPVRIPPRLKSAPGSFFLIVSRLHRHKDIDMAIKTCNKMKWPLIIVGTGPQGNALRKIAGPTIRMRSDVNDVDLDEYYDNCLALIMPQEEDFGITAIEALAHGKPVIALQKGGAREYIDEGSNGIFFGESSEELLADGIRRFYAVKDELDPLKIREGALRFGEEQFHAHILDSLHRFMS